MSLSLITTTLNSESTFSRTLQSILGQEVLPKEHLIIDAGSTDKTLNIVSEYKDRAPYPVLVLNEPKARIYTALNKGIEQASGTIIGIINSDDWYEKDTLKDIEEAYKKQGSGIYFGFLRYWSEGQEAFIQRTNIHYISRMMIQHPACFVSRDIYSKHGTFNDRYRYSADLDFMINMVQAGVSFFPIDKVLANFTMGGLSSTRAAMLESLNIRYRYKQVNRGFYYRKKMKLFVQKLLSS